MLCTSISLASGEQRPDIDQVSSLLGTLGTRYGFENVVSANQLF